MNHSDSIAALAAALSKAQAAIKPAQENAKSPSFGKYADLASVWDSARDPLSQNGLAVIQSFQPAPDGCICVETMLAHSSGEWVSSILTMPVGGGNKAMTGAQVYGSAITYARRYSLAAILGIAPAGDDNDGAGYDRREEAQGGEGGGNGTQVPRADLGLWEGEGLCPSCHCPSGKKHASTCRGAGSAQAAGR